MRIKSVCPKCEKPQSRWQFFEPFPGFSNQCAKCGTDYKSGKLSLIIGLFTGFVIAALLIVSDKSIISWSISFSSSLFIIFALFYISPFFTKLKKIEDINRNIVKKWMLPFFKWQLFICIFLITSILFSCFLYILNEDTKKGINNPKSQIENMQSIDKLKKFAKWQNATIDLKDHIVKSAIELNTLIAIVVIILMVFNLLFYIKIKYLHIGIGPPLTRRPSHTTAHTGQ